MGGDRAVMGRLARAVLAASLAVSTAAVLAPAARAATTCTLDPATHVASATVDATAASISKSAGDVFIGGVDCGPATDIDSVVADMSAVILFRMPQDPIRPGFTDEGDGSSEVEIDLLSVRADAEYSVGSTTGPDDVDVGQTGAAVINLNPTADGGAPDADVTLDGLPTIALYGGEGDDVLSGDGLGDGTSGPYPGRMRLHLAEGNDTVTGGVGDDQIWLQDWRLDGADTVSGGAGTDELRLKGHLFASASITLDGRANDGTACPGPHCDHDDIGSDIERIYGSGTNEYISGGAGRQFIHGGRGDDVLLGRRGHDELIGYTGADRLFGGAGADRLDGVVGPDILYGGPGVDTATFGVHDFVTDRTRGVRVDLDGRPDDGAPRENDNVFPDVEIVHGTRFRDVLTGARGRQSLFGGPGDDVLRGRGGDDRLVGRAGDDTLDGGAGRDLCRQSSGTGTKISCER
jgi:Ca2+-binding RTX toxin-like protein